MIKKIFEQLSPTGKKVLYVALAMLTLAFVDNVFLQPAVSRLKSLDYEISQKEASVQRDLRLLSYKDRIVQDNEQLAEYIPEKQGTQEEIIAGFLKNIEMLATQASINLAKVNPSEPEIKKNYLEYKASLECSGEFENVIKFMHSIDSSKDLMRIIKWTLTGKRSESNEVILVMSISKVILNPVSEMENK